MSESIKLTLKVNEIVPDKEIIFLRYQHLSQQKIHIVPPLVGGGCFHHRLLFCSSVNIILTVGPYTGTCSDWIFMKLDG